MDEYLERALGSGHDLPLSDDEQRDFAEEEANRLVQATGDGEIDLTRIIQLRDVIRDALNEHGYLITEAFEVEPTYTIRVEDGPYTHEITVGPVV